MEIVSLGYLGFGMPDVAPWRDFAHDVIGMAPGRVPGQPAFMPATAPLGEAADGSLYFKIDEWSWRVAVHPDAKTNGLLYMGLEMRGPIELRAALDELAAAGHPARMGSAKDALGRAVTGIGYTSDPAGNMIELFYGALVDDHFVSPKGMRFLTGDMGLGHLNLFVMDFAACEAFYTDVLGFRLTDYYQVGDGMSVNFYHINPRHHTIGLMQLAPVNAVHHLMFEVPDVDMVGMALDRAMAAGCKITATLGRHSNDNMLSFYMASPFGFEIEIGCDAIRVGSGWTPSYRAPGDLWGHRGLDVETIQDIGTDIGLKDIAE